MHTRLRKIAALLISGILAIGLLVLVQAVESAPPPLDQSTDGSLDPEVEGLFVNSVREDIHAAVVYTPPYVPPPASPVMLPDPVWRIGVITDGLYSLDYTVLAAAGLPVAGTAPTDYHLTWRGQDVSLDGVGIGDGTFDSGDSLIFYGEAFHGSVQEEKYTGENVYWLSIDNSTSGPLMSIRAVTPTTFTASGVCTATDGINENVRYFARWTVAPGTDTTWFYTQIPASTSAVTVTQVATYTSKTTYDIALSQTVSAVAAQIDVEMASKANMDHALMVTVNDVTVGEWTWFGKASQVATAILPSGLLTDGSNTVAIYLGEKDYTNTMYLDRIEISYQQHPTAVNGDLLCDTPSSGAQDFTATGVDSSAQLYDVSTPLQPVKLTDFAIDGSGLHFSDHPVAGTRYIAAAVNALGTADLVAYSPDNDILSPGTGADEIIIAPQEFHAALQPLIAHREAQGLRVRLVDVDDLYPLFNGGIFHPEAIRSFIAYAYTNWPGEAPSYVFLVGDGHFNMRGYSPNLYGEMIPVRIPPYLFFDDPTQGDVPVDARYGDVVSDPNGMPEVAIGRLTANTITEVEKYVEKILRYEGLPAETETWQNRVLLIADNGATYDEGFDTYLTLIKNQHLPDGIETKTMYMEEYCDSYSGVCEPATNILFGEWNAGALMLLYSGHGAVERWGHEPLIRNTDLLALTQTDGLPFLISLDCWDGYWMRPLLYQGSTYDQRSIGEWVTAVLTETGAIGAFAPAGLGYSNEEYQLTSDIMDSYFLDGERRLGTLSQAGRVPISRTYMARTYTLLGDPAALMHSPSYTPNRHVYVPLALR